MHPSTIINIEMSQLPNRLYVIYTISGDKIHIGNRIDFFYGGGLGTKTSRKVYYHLLSDKEINMLGSLKPSRLLYETYVLNGYSKSLVKNINFFNSRILRNTLGV
jgi:hypothetical protein